jgi:hypothetical protein
VAEGNGQTPMGGPAGPMLTPEEYALIGRVLNGGGVYSEADRALQLSAHEKVGNYLSARQAWTDDAKARKLKTDR